MPHHQHICPVRRVTDGPKAHFFGYYDKPPWNAAGDRMLCLEAPPVDRMPKPGEKAGIGIVDLEGGTLEVVAETAAWNWQQGSMLQWLPGSDDRRILFNDCRDGRHVAVLLDIHSGKEQLFPKPAYDISGDGCWALTNNFARLAEERLVVGYAGAVDPWSDVAAPEDDGVFRMELPSGRCELILSLHEAAHFESKSTMAGVKHRFEHVTINPDDTRFFVLQRWPREGKGRPFYDRLLTADTSGGDLHVLADDDMVSHFDWRDSEHLLAWARQEGRGDHFYLFKDRSRRAEVVGEDVLTCDGHCSYSPDRRWILSDTYPDNWEITILLYEIAASRRIDVFRCKANPALYKIPGIRCDRHPRWRQDGRAVCIDSAHEGTRQMYVIDVADVIES